MKQYLCVTCRERSADEVLIRIQANTLPNYCYNLRTSADNYDALDPALIHWGIDIELDWNPIVDYDMAKITEDHVRDIPLTTDLLCSPGNYTDTDYKLDSLYKSFGNTWSGHGSNLPREVIGFALNGAMIAQSLTSDGVDPFYPGAG